MARTLSSRRTRPFRLAGIVAAIGLVALAGASALAPVGSNLERIERSAAVAADSLLDAVDARDSLCVAVVPHAAAWIVERAIVERAAARGVAISRCDAAEARRLDVAITSVGVVYATAGDVRTRTASVAISASTPIAMAESGPAGALRSIRAVSDLVDTLDAADTAGLADAAYPFTVGIDTAADSGGFWQKIVEPAVVLAASAIVAILLFTVRSQ